MSTDIELFVTEEKTITKNSLKALVVDDSKSMREMISHILTESGFEVITAVDGMDAMHYYLKTKFDYVVTDLHMPKMDGHQLLRQIANVSKANSHKTRVLVSSSDSKKPTILKILAVARNANNSIPLSFLVKPWKEVDLLTQTRNLFPKQVKLIELEKQIDILNQEELDETPDSRLIIGMSETEEGIKIELGSDQQLSLESASISEYLESLENAIFFAPVKHYTCCLSKMTNQTPVALITLLLLIRGLADKHGKVIQFVEASPIFKEEVKRQGLSDILEL